jgi:hypothetical protein
MRFVCADRTSRACSPNTDNAIRLVLTVTPTESAYDDVTERLPRAGCIEWLDDSPATATEK